MSRRKYLKYLNTVYNHLAKAQKMLSEMYPEFLYSDKKLGEALYLAVNVLDDLKKMIVKVYDEVKGVEENGSKH